MPSTVQQATAKVLLFYPGDNLVARLKKWEERAEGRQLRLSFVRDLPAIRDALRHADVTVIDATEDDARAVDALLQAVARKGPDRVALHTEQMHDGLELFVRTHRVLLVLGPLEESEWEDFLSTRLAAARQAPRRGRLAA